MKTHLIASLVIASAGLAFAADEPKKPTTPAEQADAIFAKRDKDKDGKLSKEEFLKGKKGDELDKYEKSFPLHDANSDGFITKEEYVAAAAKRAANAKK